MTLNKVIIAPDSFKGTLGAKQAADVIAAEVAEAFPDCKIVKMPIADGGEGSVDTIMTTIGGESFETQVLSPDDRMIGAYYAIASNGTAIIEMAQSSGITKQKGLHPMTSTTFGFGQLIMAALDCGAREFILCIGGSATTDGGCGMGAALGIVYNDAEGNSFIPCGATLSKVAAIDMSGLDSRVSTSSFTVMCDVDNPLYGTRGAAHIYSPQKGATPEQVLFLDEGLRLLGGRLKESFGKDFAKTPGAGAAGGLGAGCMAFLGANLMSGIEAILKICGFENHLKDADLIITGEGKLDSQSFYGKVLSGILSKAGKVPVWSICGICECDEALLHGRGIMVFQTSEGISVEESMSNTEKYLRIAARRALHNWGGRA